MARSSADLPPPIIALDEGLEILARNRDGSLSDPNIQTSLSAADKAFRRGEDLVPLVPYVANDDLSIRRLRKRTARIRLVRKVKHVRIVWQRVIKAPRLRESEWSLMESLIDGIGPLFREDVPRERKLEAVEALNAATLDALYAKGFTVTSIVELGLLDAAAAMEAESKAAMSVLDGWDNIF